MSVDQGQAVQNGASLENAHLKLNQKDGIDNMGSMNNTLLVGSTSSNTPSESGVAIAHKNESYESDAPLVDNILLEDAISPEVQDSAASLSSSSQSSEFEIVNENK